MGIKWIKRKVDKTCVRKKKIFITWTKKNEKIILGKKLLCGENI